MQPIMNSFTMVSWPQTCSFPCRTHPLLPFSLKKSSPLYFRALHQQVLHPSQIKFKTQGQNFVIKILRSIKYILYHRISRSGSLQYTTTHMPMQVQQWRSDKQGSHNSFKNKWKWNMQTQKQGTSTVILGFTYLAPLASPPPLWPPLLNGFPCVVWSLLQRRNSSLLAGIPTNKDEVLILQINKNSSPFQFQTYTSSLVILHSHKIITQLTSFKE